MYQLAEKFQILKPEWLAQMLTGREMADWFAFLKMKNLLEQQAVEKLRLKMEAKKQLGMGAGAGMGAEDAG